MPKARGKGKVSGGVVIAAFIVMIIGLSLTPTVASLTQGASDLSPVNTTTYDSAEDIIALIPLFWAILMLAIPVAAIGLYFMGV